MRPLTHCSLRPALPRWWLAVGLVAVATWVAGCATRVEVLPIASNGPPVYDLRGRQLAELQNHAKKVCPNGHEQLRTWQQLNRPDGQAGMVATYWMKPFDWVDPARDDRAQLLIQCSASAP